MSAPTTSPSPRSGWLESRTKEWLKVKIRRRQEFVVGGWTHGKGARENEIGALLLGYHDKSRRLRYAGLVGTGFDQQEQRRLLAALRRRVHPDG